MKKQLILMAAVVVLGSFCLSAQEQSPGPPPGQMPGMRPGGPGGGHGFGRPGFGLHGGKVVTGVPYSASVSNTSIERLSDGNTIQHTTTGQIARDSLGRTYEQQTITGGPLGSNGTLTLTFISDPVAGYAYTLNSKTNTAMRHPIKARTEGAETPADGQPGLARRGMQGSAEVAETDLGSDASSGVSAEGKKITRTIPANTIGNSQAITSTSERWYSSDLQIVVKAIRNDPRFGQSTYSLTSVVAKEPDASLFKVPSSFTVQDAPQHGHRQ